MAEGSSGRVIHGGLVGPKPRLQSVGDGQTVDIPLPRGDEYVHAGCGVGYSERRVGVAASKRAGADGGFARRRSRGVGNPGYTGDSLEARLPEKPGAGSPARPYRRPTQVAGCESTKVDE